MGIQYQEQRYPSFQEYVEHHHSRGMSHWDSTPLYAHPVDAWILHTLNSTPVKAVINKAIDALVSFQFGHELAGGVFIDRNSFPELFDTLIHCSKTLGIPLPHAVAKHDLSLFNAYTAGTDEYAFINVSSALCEYFTGDEVRFIIGHECGHIASGHMVYHTLVNVLTGVTLNTLGPLGQILRATAGVPLMAWSRRSEVTADRAGLLCCGDVHVAERALLRLVTGFAGVEQVDLEDYLRRFKSMHEFHKLGSLHEYMASHPMIPKRIEALRLFADSELYYSLSGKRHPTGKALLTREQLDRRVKEIVKP